jgi:hypothetical protein
VRHDRFAAGAQALAPPGNCGKEHNRLARASNAPPLRQGAA